MEENTVYEVIDRSNDEMFYPLGLFPTFSDAHQEVKNLAEKDRPVSEFVMDDFERIEIQARDFGWTEHGKTVYAIERQRQYIEEEDDVRWQTVGEEATPHA